MIAIRKLIRSISACLRRAAVVAGLLSPTWGDVSVEAAAVLRARAIGDRGRERAARNRHARMLERATTAKA